MICKKNYLPVIRKSVQKEVSDCDTCQHLKRSNKDYALPDKVAVGIPWNTLCVYLICP